METQCWTRVTEGENLRSKSQCVKVAGNEKNRFWCICYLRQKWINLRQTKTHCTHVVYSLAEVLRYFNLVCLSHTSNNFRLLSIGTPYIYFVFCGDLTTYTIEWWSNSKMKMEKVKVTGNENAKKTFLCTCISSWKVNWFTSNQDQSD